MKVEGPLQSETDRNTQQNARNIPSHQTLRCTALPGICLGSLPGQGAPNHT